MLEKYGYGPRQENRILFLALIRRAVPATPLRVEIAVSDQQSFSSGSRSLFPYKRASDGSPEEGRTYSGDAALSGQDVHRALFGEEFDSQWSPRAKASPAIQAGRRKPGRCEASTGVAKGGMDGLLDSVSSIAQPVCRGSCVGRSDVRNESCNWFNGMIESPDLSCGA